MEKDRKKNNMDLTKSKERTRCVLRTELNVAVCSLDVWVSYFLQLTFIENPLCTGNAIRSKRGSKHPSRESGYVTDKYSGLRAGTKSLQGIYGNKKDTQDKGVARHDFLGEMPLPSCGTLGKIFKLSVLQFSHL